MNERIQELARQVGAKPIYYEFLTGYEIPGKDGLEKFAELIIDECIDVVIESDNNPKMIVHEPYRTIMENIREHFGVE